MADLTREKATAAQDLPHQYASVQDLTDYSARDVCALCWTGPLDARHLAWERAAATTPTPPRLTRELGT